MSRREVLAKRVRIAAAFLAMCAGMAVLITFSVRRPRSQSVSHVMAPAPPLPSFVLTQFAVGGPFVLATQAVDGSLVIVTQYDVPSLGRFFMANPNGTESEFDRRQAGVQSLGLFDFRARPEIKLDDLK